MIYYYYYTRMKLSGEGYINLVRQGVLFLVRSTWQPQLLQHEQHVSRYLEIVNLFLYQRSASFLK